MRKAMEHALIRLSGEVDLLGQQLAYREQELGRVKGAFRGILKSQGDLLKAVAAGVGFGRVDEITTD
jgi:hypothetical protein